MSESYQKIVRENFEFWATQIGGERPGPGEMLCKSVIG